MNINKSVLALWTIAICFLTSCHDFKKNVDLIIYNANVFTENGFSKEINCIAVDMGKIVLVGSDAEIRSRYWATKYVDAKKNFVYPGFIDAHSHFTGFAQSLRFADLSQANSFDEVLSILIDFHKTHNSNWIVGRGWDQNKWTDKQFPDNEKLNALFPDIPVVLMRVDGHALLASDAAIKATGIDINSPSNEIVKRNGKPIGIFLETLADKIRNQIPEPSENEMEELMITAAELCYMAGLTAVTDAGLNYNELMRINKLQREETLYLRIDAWLNFNNENIEKIIKMDKKLFSPLLRAGAIKVYADGALGSRGACLKYPYTDHPGHTGIQVTSSAELENICKIAYSNGFQVNTHAIGDSAVSMVLNTYAKILRPSNDRRWRIEHAQVVDPKDISKFGKYRIVPSIQSTHATSDMMWAEERLGKKRIKHAYAYQDLLNENGWLPNGTDFPIEKIDPLLTFYAAISRKNLNGEPVSGFQSENALTRLQALKSMTIWAAKASFQEAQYGEIAKNRMGSFTILDKNILEVPESELFNAKVLFTIINGKVVYASKK